LGEGAAEVDGHAAGGWRAAWGRWAAAATVVLVLADDDGHTAD